MKEPLLKLNGNMDVDVTLQGDEVPPPTFATGFWAR